MLSVTTLAITAMSLAPITYAFGDNTGNNSNEFGTDYRGRGGDSGVVVGGHYGDGAGAGVFGRSYLSWTGGSDGRGFRAMAYPNPKVKTRYKLTANGGGGHTSQPRDYCRKWHYFW